MPLYYDQDVIGLHSHIASHGVEIALPTKFASRRTDLPLPCHFHQHFKPRFDGFTLGLETAELEGL